MTVVFDTNVVVEAIFWPRSTARRALTGLARRRFQTVINSAIMEEYAVITAQVREKLFSNTQPSGALAWLAAKSLHVEPSPMSGKLSRDPDDNLFVATAVAAGAKFLATQDPRPACVGKTLWDRHRDARSTCATLAALNEIRAPVAGGNLLLPI